MFTWKITLADGRCRLIRAGSETWAWNKARVYWREQVRKVEAI